MNDKLLHVKTENQDFSLGFYLFERMTIELLYFMLQQLEIKDIAHFLRTAKKIKQVIEGAPYKIIKENGQIKSTTTFGAHFKASATQHQKMKQNKPGLL